MVVPTLEGFRYCPVTMVVPEMTQSEMRAWDMTSFGSFKDERYEQRLSELSADYSLRNPF